MVSQISLACSYMMMECPRCGFTQPQDRYCAKCGLDIEHYVAKPKPLWVRLVQNPDFHLSLIVVLVMAAVGYIFYSQSTRLGRQVHALLNGTPLTSRDAAVPGADAGNRKAAPQKPTALPAPAPAPEVNAVVPVDGSESQTSAGTVEKSNLDLARAEVSQWEVPHEVVAALLGTADKVGEGSGGRAYSWTQGSKTVEAIQNGGRRLGGVRRLEAGAKSQLAYETPATSTESFQFGLYFQLSKNETKDFGVKWDSTLILPPPESPAEAASQIPVVRSLTETTLSGSANLGSQSVLVLIFDPSNRTLREDAVQKAGQGPWTIFNSEEFRTGATDWVVLVQLK